MRHTNSATGNRRSAIARPENHSSTADRPAREPSASPARASGSHSAAGRPSATPSRTPPAAPLTGHHIRQIIRHHCVAQAEQADKAIALNKSNAQAHLWLADSRRQLAAIEKDKDRQRTLYSQAREDYRAFLTLTNYSTNAANWLAFHFIGFHLGARRHADRQPAYDALRTSGFLGLCLSESKVGNPRRAVEYCERALGYSPRDPIAFFLLGNVNRDLYNEFQSCGYITAARSNYARMISLNPDLDESKNAKNYLDQITGLLPKLGCKGCGGCAATRSPSPDAYIHPRVRRASAHGYGPAQA